MEGTGEANVAKVARLFGDETRASMCMALLDGRYLTAGELARAARVAPSTASEQLSQLVAGGILQMAVQGRRRYFTLADPEVAAALEALAVVAPRRQVRSLGQDLASKALQAGRTCYDHLAGRLGISVTEALIERGVITDSYGLGDLSPLESLQLDVHHSARRLAVRPCLDWTERRHHAAGAMPAALTRRLFELGWLERTCHPRAARMTHAGSERLGDLLGMPLQLA